MIRASTRCATRWSARERALHPGLLRPDKRSIGNAVQVFFRDGSSTRRIEIEFPIGHRTRRAEGIPLLVRKFETSVKGRLTERQFAALKSLSTDQQKLEATPVDEFMALLVSG
jgi:2-methylcitrate dehydratase